MNQKKKKEKTNLPQNIFVSFHDLRREYLSYSHQMENQRNDRGMLELLMLQLMEKKNNLSWGECVINKSSLDR